MPDSPRLLDIFSLLIAEHPVALLASLGLLCMSATYSGCETSLFSLTAPELNRIRAGKTGIDAIIAKLHANLKLLLPTILFCNMAVNVLIFSLSASIASTLGGRYGAGIAFLASLVSLFLVVFFGEVFPKQFAISSSLMVAKLTALPVWICYRLLEKPMRILNWTVTACERVLDHGRPDSGEVREEELKLLVELSKNDGVISDGEYELIDGIVDLPAVRIRDIMIPRVDARPLPTGATMADAVATARRNRHCKIPVLDVCRDDLAGWVDVRDIYPDLDERAPDGGGGIDAYLKRFRYFSEHDRVDQALERIKESRADLFAVVDERGLVIGFFTTQDIMDEVLGHFGEHGAPPPSGIRELAGGYVISGRVSVREWRELFDVSEAIPRSATVGGLVVALLGRMPKIGDRVRLENMEMTVLATHRNRVAEVGLRLIPPAPAANGNGNGKGNKSSVRATARSSVRMKARPSVRITSGPVPEGDAGREA